MFATSYSQFKRKLFRNGISKGIFYFLGALILFMLTLGFLNLKSDENTAWMWFTFTVFGVIFTLVFCINEKQTVYTDSLFY